MKTPQTRETVRQLHDRGVSVSEIARILMIDRKTVRSILSKKQDEKPMKASRYEEHLPLIRELFTRCRGNVSRVRYLHNRQHERSCGERADTRQLSPLR